MTETGLNCYTGSNQVCEAILVKFKYSEIIHFSSIRKPIQTKFM